MLLLRLASLPNCIISVLKNSTTFYSLVIAKKTNRDIVKRRFHRVQTIQKNDHELLHILKMLSIEYNDEKGPVRVCVFVVLCIIC